MRDANPSSHPHLRRAGLRGAVHPQQPTSALPRRALPQEARRRPRRVTDPELRAAYLQGGCPHRETEPCGANDGVLLLEPSLWGVCFLHRTKWQAGRSKQRQSAPEWKRNARLLAGFTKVRQDEARRARRAWKQRGQRRSSDDPRSFDHALCEAVLRMAPSAPRGASWRLK